jgi:iron complex outermembrane receptor protein
MMKLKTLRPCVFLLLLITAVSNSLPQDAVEEITVTGRLYSITAPSRSIQVITGLQIQELGLNDLSDLFGLLESVQISRRGPLDSSFDLTLRGGNFEQTLILVNGIPFGNPQTGHFSTDLPFSLDDIERVEVLKGGNTIYGTGSFSGAINLILRKSANLSFSISAGEHALLGTQISAGRRFGNLSTRISANRHSTRGFYTGREMEKLSVNAGLHFQESGTRADLFAGWHANDFGADGFYAPYPSREETGQTFIQGHVSRQLDRFTLNLQGSLQHHSDDFFLDRQNPDFFFNHSDTLQCRINGSLGYLGSRVQILAGGEFRSQQMDSLSMGFRYRRIPSIFSDLRWVSPDQKWGVDLAGRVEFFRSTPQFIFQAGIHAAVTSVLRITGGISRSLRYPSFTELYYYSPSNIGDPDLFPEHSLNLESALSWTPGNQVFRFCLFARRHRNLIDWISSAPGLPWEAVNLSRHRINGFEISHRWEGEGLQINSSLERLLSFPSKQVFTSKYSLRYPDFTIKVNLHYRISHNIFLGGRYTYKEILNTPERGHFLDLTLGFQLTGKWTLRLAADNLLNTRIAELPGIPTAGRWLSFGIRYQ